MNKDPSVAIEQSTDEPATSSGSLVEPFPHKVTVDQLLTRLELRHNVVLVTEVLLGLLVLYTIDTFSYYGNNIDYTNWRCGVWSSLSHHSQCSNLTTNFNRTTLCTTLHADPSFPFIWGYGPDASFSAEFGMFCGREVESSTILDISGIGAGLGALVGGILGDLFGRRLSGRLGIIIIFLSLITLAACQTVQILTLGLFLLGFAVYMCLNCLVVLVFELLPLRLHFPFVVVNSTFPGLGAYLGCAIRFVIYSSWRAVCGSLIVMNCVLVPLLVHIPVSPRLYPAKHALNSLHKLSIALLEGEELVVVQEPSLPLDYRTNRTFMWVALVVLYLRAVIALTSPPSAGKVWELITDKNVQYVVQATLNLAAIPILCYMVTRANTVILKTYIVLFGWVSVGCYFIGEVPLGWGLYTLNNAAGLLLNPFSNILETLIILYTLQISPTCYRATTFGLSLFLEKCFLKMGSLLSTVDSLPSDSSSHVQSAHHEYSFLVFGVLFLTFLYVASYLPPLSTRTLPNSVREFNDIYRNNEGKSEESRLLRMS